MTNASPDSTADIRHRIEASIAVKQAMLEDAALLRQVDTLAQACLVSLQSGGKMIFAGNGGSFSDALHLSAEFTSRLMFDRAPLASVVLGANGSSMSAIANDYGYDQVFARELSAIGQRQDVFIPITTSGNSPNLLSTIPAARKIGLTTVALTGATGGKLAPLCDCIRVPSTTVARIQECHIMVGHIICEFVERGLFSPRPSTDA